VISLVLSLAAVLAAVAAVLYARVQAKAAQVQATAAKDQASAAKEQAISSREQLEQTAKNAETAARQAEAYSGAQSAIAWRDQVFSLHDRGLTPGQIRYIMHLEDGGAGYEGWNGRIDDLVRDVPRAQFIPDSSIIGDSEIMSCDEMPIYRDSCIGPCRDTTENNGCGDFRKADIGSPNESAGR
jgi:hypothetical protein